MYFQFAIYHRLKNIPLLYMCFIKTGMYTKSSCSIFKSRQLLLLCLRTFCDRERTRMTFSLSLSPLKSKYTERYNSRCVVEIDELFLYTYICSVTKEKKENRSRRMVVDITKNDVAHIYLYTVDYLWSYKYIRTRAKVSIRRYTYIA